mmetsp:Transcript_141671/g.200640  ORF Transcript_141671/g.200640 Transcript_141671/m.200640 type:complete len:237 (-) Transcript_141671:167-877(-)
MADASPREYGPNVKVLELNAQMRAVMTIIRDRECSVETFRFYADRIVRFVVESGLAEVPYIDETITTPTQSEYSGLKFGAKLCGVSIVRAGESMETALMQCCRAIRIGKILIQRNEETALPTLYYSKLPQDIHRRTVLLLDPMLATGGSAAKAIEVLIEAGVDEGAIVFLNIISCPEGLRALTGQFPKIKIVTAEVDSHLDDKKYIIPGIGDFGDRYFGTDLFDYKRERSSVAQIQ